MLRHPGILNTVIGTITTANYMYVMPRATFVAGYFGVSEPISQASAVGLSLIVSGVYLTEARLALNHKIQKVLWRATKPVKIRTPV